MKNIDPEEKFLKVKFLANLEIAKISNLHLEIQDDFQDLLQS
jgi:hypothetical protein